MSSGGQKALSKMLNKVVTIVVCNVSLTTEPEFSIRESGVYSGLCKLAGLIQKVIQKDG